MTHIATHPQEDPKLWYGIGILYDRYGSLDHAEEAFSSVLRMDKGACFRASRGLALILSSEANPADFDKANEILFRLGIIYKQQGKYQESLECFDRILKNPPNPLAHADIWFQIGHVYEQMRDVSETSPLSDNLRDPELTCRIRSSFVREMPTSVSSGIIPGMLRSSNNWGGFTIKTALPSRIRISRSSISPRV